MVQWCTEQRCAHHKISVNIFLLNVQQRDNSILWGLLVRGGEERRGRGGKGRAGEGGEEGEGREGEGREGEGREWEERDGRKGEEGREGKGKGEGADGGTLCRKGWKGEGRKGREGTGKGRGGRGWWGPFAARGCRGREEGKERRNGELTVTPEP